MIKLRDYQQDIVERGTRILREHRLLYLAMEVRTGKTLTSLSICDSLGVENVLFITKKKAISSITEDVEKGGFCHFNFWCINYESLHKIPDVDWDVIVCDEAHSMSKFPTPSNRAKHVRKLLEKCNPYYILLSGTPTPESFSQMYHQVYGHRNNPFRKYKNFYKFAHDFVRVTSRKINSNYVNDYSNGRKEILEVMKPYTISYSQKQAGFQTKTTETVLKVKMSDTTYKIVNMLKKNLVVEGKQEVILADTSVKLMMKLHQLFSGTIKFESGNSTIIDTTKAQYIYNKFKGKKIGIFYKFKEELNAIKEVYNDSITTDIKEFQDTNKNIALQIVSGREGISLKQAVALVYYNIDFSATSYWQSRDRMTTKDRLKNDVYWVFSENGIEQKIYDAVSKKKDYTLSHFKNDLRLL